MDPKTANDRSAPFILFSEIRFLCKVFSCSVFLNKKASLFSSDAHTYTFYGLTEVLTIPDLMGKVGSFRVIDNSLQAAPSG